MIELINQFFELELKTKEFNTDKLDRNFKKINSLFEAEGFIVENPMGMDYKIENTAIEANFIASVPVNIISKVLKPAIFKKLDNGQLQLIQKAIVVVD